MRRLLTRAGAALAAAAFVLVGLAGPAWAHNQLVGSTPADQSSVDAGPSTVELTFDQPVQGNKDVNSIVVLGPGDTQWQDGDIQVSGNKVSVGARELGPAGEYRVAYRILSADGHPVRGEVEFTLTTAGNGTPASTAAPADTAEGAAADGSDDGGVPVWVWIAGAVVLLGVGVFAAMRVGAGPAR